uniref:Tail fiber protein n=3 Tax=unclassified bacterial viruses TaxID=12333 RepID=A0AAU6W0L8_9VIRU
MSGYVTKADDPSLVYFYINADRLMYLKLDGTYETVMLKDLKPQTTQTFQTLAGKPETYPPTIGTTATTAKAGNYQPGYAEVQGADAGVRAAMRNKPEILALTQASTGLDLTAILGKLNAVIAAIKA